MKALGARVPRGRDGAAQVHLPREAATDLHGLQSTPEGPGEDAFDQAFEASLELL